MGDVAEAHQTSVGSADSASVLFVAAPLLF